MELDTEMAWNRLFLGFASRLKSIFTLPKRKMSRAEAADIIDRFVHHKEENEWEWDDFCIGDRYADPVIQRIVDECMEIDDKYPAKGAYCNVDGMARLLELRDELLANPE